MSIKIDKKLVSQIVKSMKESQGIFIGRLEAMSARIDNLEDDYFAYEARVIIMNMIDDLLNCKPNGVQVDARPC